MIWGVLQFPGSCDERDALNACTIASGGFGGHAKLVWHEETDLSGFDGIVVPGGFSYGDYLRCGAIAARSPIMADVKAKALKGLKVLGVCNGFQIITEAGLLPGALVRNASLHFVCREVKLTIENNATWFTNRMAKGQVVTCPHLYYLGRLSSVSVPPAADAVTGHPLPTPGLSTAGPRNPSPVSGHQERKEGQ